MNIRLPGKVNKLITHLEASGFEAYAVGGCVRDSLMGRIPNDWDLCTNASPDEMKRCFADFRVIETGLKHGTLTVLLEGETFEITTYRIDGEYSDGRHPDQVTFTRSLKEDLARRDFTVNAMAYNDTSGIVDYFGGRDDLEAGILRCVGEPELRFTEDSLRILRCVRFASQLGFTIENSTVKAMNSCLPLLDRVAAERIRVELEKLLCGPDAVTVLRHHRDIIAHIIPEIRPIFDLDQRNGYHIYDVWEHSLQVLSNIPAEPVLRLAAFFHDIGKPGVMTIDYSRNPGSGWGHFYGHEAAGAEITDSIMRRLRFDNSTRKMVVDVIDAHKIIFQANQKHARRLLMKLGEETLRNLIQLELADVKGQNPVYTEERVSNILSFRDALDEVIAREQCFSIKHLAINGGDLLALGIPQGREIGRILNELLEQVVDGNLENSRPALTEYVKKNNAAQ